MSNLIAKPITNHLKVGYGVRRFEDAEDAGAAGRVGCLGIYHLKAQLKGVAALIATYFEPDLIGRYAAIVPTETVVSVRRCTCKYACILFGFRCPTCRVDPAWNGLCPRDWQRTRKEQPLSPHHLPLG